MTYELNPKRFVRCKVADLTGYALDLAVTLYQGDANLEVLVSLPPKFDYADITPYWGVAENNVVFRPSINGEHARPFIEQAGIGLRKTAKGWTARIWNLAVATGPDYLTAAMRCFVMSVEGVRTSLPAEFIERHYGFALDIPRELLEAA